VYHDARRIRVGKRRIRPSIATSRLPDSQPVSIFVTFHERVERLDVPLVVIGWQSFLMDLDWAASGSSVWPPSSIRVTPRGSRGNRQHAVGKLRGKRL
jgi:hypothetical protein